MESSNYKPIDCSFYDQLLVFASGREEVELIYESRTIKQTEISLIKDVYTKNKAEFIELASGSIIRLDNIISVNGIQLSGASCSIR